MQGDQGSSWHSHVAQSDGHICHDATEWGAYAKKSGLCLRCTCLGLLRLHLRLSGIKLGLRTVQRALADVLFLEQLFLSFKLFACYTQIGLSSLKLRRTAHHILLCCTGVDAQQLLSRLDPVTRFELKLTMAPATCADTLA